MFSRKKKKDKEAKANKPEISAPLPLTPAEMEHLEATKSRLLGVKKPQAPDVPPRSAGGAVALDTQDDHPPENAPPPLPPKPSPKPSPRTSKAKPATVERAYSDAGDGFASLHHLPGVRLPALAEVERTTRTVTLSSGHGVDVRRVTHGDNTVMFVQPAEASIDAAMPTRYVR